MEDLISFSGNFHNCCESLDWFLCIKKFIQVEVVVFDIYSLGLNKETHQLITLFHSTSLPVCLCCIFAFSFITYFLKLV